MLVSRHFVGFASHLAHMRLHRFLVQKNLVLDTLLIEDEAIIHQWLHVFRFQSGQEVLLCDGKGKEVLAILDELNKKRVLVRVLEHYPDEPASTRHVTLCLSLTKRDSFEWALQKATEVGVTAIQPLLSERSIKHALNMERSLAIIREAVEQSGRKWMPELLPMLSFEEVLQHRSKDQVDLLCEGGAKEALKALESPVRVFIGPEGGWSEEELVLAKKSKVKMVGLGATVLRAETAATVAGFIMMQ